MGKSNTVFAPLKILREVTDKYPTIWEYLEKVREKSIPTKLASKYTYNSYIPRITLCEILKVDKITDDKKYQDATAEACAIAALASWRRFKQVYSFDENLKNMLFLQAEYFDEELELPSAILKQLPYPSIFVECDFEMNMYAEPMGFLTHYELAEDEMGNIMYLLVVTFFPSNGSVFPIHFVLDEKNSIKDNVHDFEETFITKFKTDTGYTDEEIKNNKVARKDYDDYINLSMRLLNKAVKRAIILILYLCAKNAEVSENPEHEKIFKPYTQGSKEKYNNIRKWDVGIKTGQAIKHMQVGINKIDDIVAVKNRIDNEDRQCASKRPHTRRAHFHHYWTGGKNEPSQRKLELKWLAPMTVNMDGIDDIIVTRTDIVIS